MSQVDHISVEDIAEAVPDGFDEVGLSDSIVSEEEIQPVEAVADDDVEDTGAVEPTPALGAEELEDADELALDDAEPNEGNTAN